MRGVPPVSLRHVVDWENRPEACSYTEFADVAVGGGDRVFGLTRDPGRVFVFEPDGTFVRCFGEEILERAKSHMPAGEADLSELLSKLAMSPYSESQK